MTRTIRNLVCASLLLELAGCSGTATSNGAGGATDVGAGGSGTGGTTSASGGVKSTSTVGVGGTSPGTGGALATGGTTVGAGGNATGGANPTGGSTSASTGGANAAGGSSSTAGAKATGGVTSTGGTKAGSGGAATGGTKAAGGTSSTGGSGTGGATMGTPVSVLQHHNHASRDGIYVDAALTKASAANLHIDTSFAGATLSGPTYAQPLYLAANGSGPDLVIAVTEQNRVYAFDAATGTQVYNVLLASPIQSSALPCGNITPQLGITGTPIIDAVTRTLYVDAMTGMGSTASSARHQVYALNADTGVILTGWPVDLNAKVTAGSTTFNSLVQNQRGALALLGGKVFVPFGGHLGDCQSYHGWIVGISTTDPTQVSAWATRAIAGGVWAPGGIASDGTSLFFATGNTEANANSFAPPNSWQDGETIFKLSPSLAAASAMTDYFTPTDWSTMDQNDQDLGGTNPIVFDVTGANPSGLVIGLGKDGKAYLLERGNLGGISAPLAGTTVGGSIINAAAEYTTSTGTYVVFKGGTSCPSGQSGGLMAIKIGATSPPTVSVAWCGGPTTQESPAVSMSNAQGQDAIVWIVGSDNKLHGLDASTGASVYAGGTGTDTMSAVQKFQTPIVANGRVFVAANGQLYAFTP